MEYVLTRRNRAFKFTIERVRELEAEVVAIKQTLSTEKGKGAGTPTPLETPRSRRDRSQSSAAATQVAAMNAAAAARATGGRRGSTVERAASAKGGWGFLDLLGITQTASSSTSSTICGTTSRTLTLSTRT